MDASSMGRGTISQKIAIGLVCLVAGLNLGSWSASSDLHASTVTTSLAMTADRADIGRNDTVSFDLWLNVSGVGQLDGAAVNLSFRSYPSGTIGSPAAIAATAETHPSACVFRANLGVNGAFLEWQCGALSAGASYAWTVTALVNASIRPGGDQDILLNSLSQMGGTNIPDSAALRLYVEGADLSLSVASTPPANVRPGQLVIFYVNVSNAPIDPRLYPDNASLSEAMNESVAHNITVAVAADPEFNVGPGLSRNFTVLPQGTNVSVIIEAIVESNAPIGSSLDIRANLTYKDFNSRPIGPLVVGGPPLTVTGSSLFSALNLIVGAGIGLGAILATTFILLYLGQRRLAIDEAFLLHRTGALIRHATRLRGVKRDDALVARTFVAIQDFVRDSFSTQAALDEVSFGGRQAAVVRGQFLILAVVLSKGKVVHLYPEMLAAVRAMEGAYAGTFAVWDGRVERLAGIDAMLDRFVHGGFRAAWRARFT